MDGSPPLNATVPRQPAMLGVRGAANDRAAHDKAVEAEFRLVEFDLSASSSSLRHLAETISVLRKNSAFLRLIAVDLGWPETAPYQSGTEALVDGLNHLADAGLDIVRLQPATPDATAQLATVQLAEQLRRATGLRTLIGGPTFTAEQLRTEIVAARVDLAETWPTPYPTPAPASRAGRAPAGSSAIVRRSPAQPRGGARLGAVRADAVSVFMRRQARL
ncbi:hypothetical protein E1287_36125 [Actinomadura sp. KC06]|uniref:hypothetical protein n=1 Tax=Actinomadura sp. KC06 TaxID=2530369 RepID=UPI00104AE30D|nr:hypothetical protein [Actinomadura sp. KC06]TDD26649.1 hypothetical protein E1287_36125 [Actinomadura sp. KC06]